MAEHRPHASPEPREAWAGALAKPRLVLARTTAIVDLLLECVTSLALAAIVTINASELVVRNLGNHSFVWGYEVNLLLANWCYFLGICLVYHRNIDITVNFLVDWLPADARRIWLVVVNVAGTAMLATVAWYGWSLIEIQRFFRTTTLGIPQQLHTIPVVIGALVMIVILARQTVDILAGAEDRSGHAY